MTKRQLASIALVILAGCAMLGTLWSAFGPEKIVLTTDQLQERVNRALPREFRGVTIARGTIAVAESRVALRIEARASALGQTVSAVVSARGVPRYADERGEIYFDPEDVKVGDFVLAGGNLVERFDRLGAPLRQRLETAAGTVIATGIRAYLTARPVYRFKDDIKGVVLKAAIADIAMEENAIAITLSVVKLTAMVAVDLVALLVIVFLIAAVIRHPRWGESVAAAAADPSQPLKGSPASTYRGNAIASVQRPWWQIVVLTISIAAFILALMAAYFSLAALGLVILIIGIIVVIAVAIAIFFGALIW